MPEKPMVLLLLALVVGGLTAVSVGLYTGEQRDPWLEPFSCPAGVTNCAAAEATWIAGRPTRTPSPTFLPTPVA